MQDSTGTAAQSNDSPILLAAVCVTLFLLWMAAGQICLCRRGSNLLTIRPGDGQFLLVRFWDSYHQPLLRLAVSKMN